MKNLSLASETQNWHFYLACRKKSIAKKKKHSRKKSYCHFLQNRSDVAAKNSVDEIVNIIRLLCRMITIVLLTQRSRLSGPFKYLARFHKGYRKFSRSIWKKVSAQNRRFSQNIPSWLWAPFLAHNWAETFFSNIPRNFFVGFIYTSKVSGRSSELISLRQ